MPAQDVITLALRSTSSIVDVLNAALALAAEVGDDQTQEWLNEEIHGYAFPDRVPDYRRIPPMPAYYDIGSDPEYGGGDDDRWVLGRWAPKYADIAAKPIAIHHSIPSLTQLRSGRKNEPPLKTPVPAGWILDDKGRPKDGCLAWYAESLRPILPAVRARVLAWAQDVAKREAKPSSGRGGVSRRRSAARNRVFIVHGHNHAVRDAIDLYLTKELGVQTMVMQAGASGGRTLPEKLEEIAAEVSFAIFILTADDILVDTRTNETIRRARQNVILEIGYFWASLGRKTGVAFLVDGHADMDLPSDLNGVEHIPITADLGQTKLQLKNELQKAGIVR
jgi:predicted nucleotide-binding protein